MKEYPSQNFLNECFDYDNNTGLYLGNLNIKMIDMVTLQEIVQEDEVHS